MTNYKFKHESVLNYRSQVEDNLKKEYLELQSALTKEETTLLECKDTHALKSDEMLVKEAMSPDEIDNFRAYLKFLKYRMSQSSLSIVKINEEMDMKREELMDASKDKKILEVIKDKGRVEYIKAEAKSEQSISDEFSINKFGK